MSVWQKKRDIGELRTLRVSAAGRGLYLYLPKDLCEQYGLVAGNRVKVKLIDVHVEVAVSDDVGVEVKDGRARMRWKEVAYKDRKKRKQKDDLTE